MDIAAKASPGRKAQLEDILAFVTFTNLFMSIERVMWVKGITDRERDGEHSFQLALVGWFINERCVLGLSTEKIIKYALVHDLPETYAGDTCWSPRGGHTSMPLKGKEFRERQAFKRIKLEWVQKFPTMVRTLESYNQRLDEESDFVYALDKLISDFNIFTDEGRANLKLRVTREMRDGYKEPRTASHKVIGELFNEMSLLFDEHPHFFHREKSAVAQ